MLVAQPRSDLLFWEMGLPLVANLGPSFVGGSSEGRKQGEGRKERGEGRIGVECGRGGRGFICVLVHHILTSNFFALLSAFSVLLLNFCIRAWASYSFLFLYDLHYPRQLGHSPAETALLVNLRVVSIS